MSDALTKAEWVEIRKGMAEIQVKDKDEQRVVFDMCNTDPTAKAFYLWYFCEYVMRLFHPEGKYKNPNEKVEVSVEPETEEDYGMVLSLDFD